MTTETHFGFTVHDLMGVKLEIGGLSEIERERLIKHIAEAQAASELWFAFSVPHLDAEGALHMQWVNLLLFGLDAIERIEGVDDVLPMPAILPFDNLPPRANLQAESSTWKFYDPRYHRFDLAFETYGQSAAILPQHTAGE